MKDLFKKYFHSLINPEEFKKFSEFLLQGKNTDAISQMMKPEWEESMSGEINSDSQKTEKFQHIIQKILSNEIEHSTRKINQYLIGLKIAAILVLGMLIYSVCFYIQSQNELKYAQLQTVSIPFGAKTRLVMPDGSIVWLNSGSTLSYSNNFSKVREVQLNGEAFFDVRKSRQPFIIDTNYGNIKVLGTAFDVLAYPESGFVTTLVRGSVQIKSKLSNQIQVLVPGEQAVLVGNGLKKSKVETELYTSWKDGKMIFKREPFPSLMKRLERWFNVRIDYSPENFNDLWYSGTIENETITEVMDMIGTAAPVEFTFNSKTRIIKIIPKEKPKK